MSVNPALGRYEWGGDTRPEHPGGSLGSQSSPKQVRFRICERSYLKKKKKKKGSGEQWDTGSNKNAGQASEKSSEASMENPLQGFSL